MRRRKVSRVSAEVVSTTEVAGVCILGSVVQCVTVSTVDCVLDGTTGAADGNETDIDEEISVVIAAAAAAKLGGAIVPEIVVGAGLVTAVDGVIVMLNAGCTNRLETGSIVLERLESDDAWAPVGEKNERGAPPENGAPNSTEAKLGVAECKEGIGMSGRKPVLELDS